MKKLLFFLLLVILLGSCEHENWQTVIAKTPPANTTPCDTIDSVHYSTVIAPLMISSCGSTDNACHTPSGAAGASYDLSTYASINSIITNPHNAPGLIISAITNDGTTSAMPKAGFAYSLSTCDKNKIIAWIHQGALNN